MDVIYVKLNQLCMTRNIRQADYDDLVKSIRATGRMEVPLQVYLINEEPSLYAIQDGHRRYQAAAELEWEGVYCVIVPPPTDPAQLIAQQLVINEHRRGLTYFEKARAYQQLKDAGWSQINIANHMGISESQVSLAISLIDADPSIQSYVESGQLSPSAVEPLLSLPKEKQAELAYAAKQARTVRGIKALVNTHKRLDASKDEQANESDIPDEIDPLDMVPLEAVNEAILKVQSAFQWDVKSQEIRSQIHERLMRLTRLALRLSVQLTEEIA